MAKKVAKLPYISIVVPLYNEERRLDNLSRIYKYLNGSKLTYEVVLINDGSKDKTLKKLKELAKTFKFKLISYRKNRGKGFAIRQGMLNSTGKYRLFTDIDLSTPLEEFNKFKQYIFDYDIVIGSRKKKGSKLLIHQPKLRERLGSGFTKLSSWFLRLDLTDFTCGFKCFSQEAAVTIFSRQRINGWGFDTEILFIGKKGGFTIKEIPVVWKNDIDTKVNLPKDVITSFIDLILIRYNNLSRRYD